MRLGWGAFLLLPGRAARVLRAGVHSTLHGVVFAIFCPSPAVHRRRDAMPGPGHEIVSASLTGRIDPTPTHHALKRGAPFSGDGRYLAGQTAPVLIQASTSAGLDAAGVAGDCASAAQQYRDRQARVASHIHTPRKAFAHDSHGFAPRVQYSINTTVCKSYIGWPGCEVIDAVCKMKWRFQAASSPCDR